MKELSAPSTRSGQLRSPVIMRVVLPVLATIVIVISGIFAYLYFGPGNASREAARVAAEQEQAMNAIADEWGIRFVHVAVLADGGLLEMRFQIVNPDRVALMFEDLEFVPWMIDEDTGTEIRLNNLPHSHDIPAGLNEFIIFRNISGVVEPGDLLTLVVGELRLEHFRVLK
jgi:hypothetical protein